MKQDLGSPRGGDVPQHPAISRLLKVRGTSAKRLVLTNDDGYQAAGLRTLWRELADEYETLVVAPSRQRSWIGKALTNPEPLTIEERLVGDKSVFVVNDGTTADCTNLALFHLSEQKPDAVISGINNGPNFTNSLTLASGTVGGALEAALNGVLGIAVSLDLDVETEVMLRTETGEEQDKIFEPAARVVKEFLRDWFSRIADPRIKLVNLVIPQRVTLPPRFIHASPLAYEYGSVFEKRGDAYYNRGRGFLEETASVTPLSDVWNVQQGNVVYTCYTGNLEQIIP